MEKNPYEISKILNVLDLPINKTITPDIIKSQYRKLSKIYHPDVAISKYKDGAKFKEINAAQEYLLENIDYVNQIIITKLAASSSYSDIRKKQEAERQRQEELQRQEAERKRQEELRRQEAERKRQEELRRQEAERKRQEELRRQEEERKRQEELRRQEEEKRQEEERRRQEELRRQEEERRRQEELRKQEEERRKQEEETIYENYNLSENIDNSNYYYDEYIKTIKIDEEELLKSIKAKRSRKIRMRVAFVTGVLTTIFFVIFGLISLSYNRGLQLLEDGKYEEAMKVLNSPINYKDTRFQYNLAKALNKLEKDSLEEAVADLESIDTVVDIQYISDFGYQPIGIGYQPSKNGYSFTDWIIKDIEVLESDNKTSVRIELEAIWQLETYTIQYNLAGGELINKNINSYSRESLVSIKNPIKEGYEFLGWTWKGQSMYKKDLILGGKTNLYGNVSLQANWRLCTYSISYQLNGGTNHQENPLLYDVNTEKISLSDPTRQGYTFGGWYNDSSFTTPFKFTPKSTEGITLYAKWIINQYTITFYSNGGSMVNPITQDYQTVVTEPIPPIRENYTFLGWYKNTSFTIPYEFDTMSSNDVVLYAKWELKKYKIFFDSNGGSVVRTISQNYNTSVRKPTDPTKEGYTFDGWYSDSSLTIAYSFTTMPAEDIELYAKWRVNKYEITYYTYEIHEPLNEIPLQLGETITSISASYNHFAAITSLGRVFTWGSNAYGQLGDGVVTKRYTPIDINSYFNLSTGEKITSISLGDRCSAAVTSKGRAFTWGYNSLGQLGDGTTTNRYSPTDITSRFNLNSGEKINTISLGNTYSVAITSSGRVFIWGANVSNKSGKKYTPVDTGWSLGTGETIVSISSSDYEYLFVTSLGRIFIGGYPTAITLTNFNLQSGEKIVCVSLSNYHSAVVTSSGRIFTWGNNRYGQLGDGTTINKTKPVEITSNFNLIIGEKIVSVSLGKYHSSVITSLGRVFTWGNNESGQLGDGTTTNSYTPKNITSNIHLYATETIVSISSKFDYSSVYTSLGRMFIWGYNSLEEVNDEFSIENYVPRLLNFRELYSTETVILNYGETSLKLYPIRSGYAFSEWYSDWSLTTPITFTSMPAHNLTLYGRWIPN